MTHWVVGKAARPERRRKGGSFRHELPRLTREERARRVNRNRVRGRGWRVKSGRWIPVAIPRKTFSGHAQGIAQLHELFAVGT